MEAAKGSAVAGWLRCQPSAQTARRTETLFWDGVVREFRSIAPRAKRKLEAINAASRLEDLRVPPSNRLEKLKGDLSGFHSIRINDQWRIIFKWLNGEPHAVQIVDYH
jgi:proteic killer suppression protein